MQYIKTAPEKSGRLSLKIDDDRLIIEKGTGTLDGGPALCYYRSRYRRTLAGRGDTLRITKQRAPVASRMGNAIFPERFARSADIGRSLVCRKLERDKDG